MTNQTKFMKYKNILFLLGAVAFAVLFGTFVVSERLETFEATARVQVVEQKVVLNTIAETIARNGADVVTESIIRDCVVSDRLRFDFLLGQLDGGLGYAELRELDQLFGSCASFFSERKSLMVARFTREIEVYTSHVALLDTLTAPDEYEKAQVAAWTELVSQEQVQSELFAELVIAQKQIITALIEGQPAGSPDIVLILNDVKEIREALLYARTKAAEARATLTAL